MKSYIPYLAAVALVASALPAPGKIIVVNTADNLTPGPNQTNLLQAIRLLQDGDTIQFNIPGSGVHYLETPPDGYPLITANRITIDGYSQPGAVPNSNPLHAPNNAQLKIVLSSINGNGLSMGIAITNYTGVVNGRYGFGETELAILGFFRGSNIAVKGLCFLSAPKATGSGVTGDMKAISFCPDSQGQCAHWHVSGCWFGVDPATRQVAYLDDQVTVAMPTISIAAYRTRDPDGSNPTYAQPGTIGVAANSTNPRAEFNVLITGYGFDSEGLNYRISGNFFNVLPDGLTNFDPSQANAGGQQGDGCVEVGRVADNLLIGTDGDGVNDADEGNLFGGVGSASWSNLYLWSSHATNVVIAGNWYGIAVDGLTRFTNSSVIVHGFPTSAQVRFGSDFDGVSDALEANIVYNNYPFDTAYPVPAGVVPVSVFDGTSSKYGALNTGVRMSFRGNVMVNCDLVPYKFANNTGLLLNSFTNFEAQFMNTDGNIIPQLDGTNSIFPHLRGTFAPGTNGYTNILVDVYQLEKESWTNGMLFMQFELTDYVSYTNGFPQGARFVGSFSVPNTGSFDVDLTGLDIGSGFITAAVSYSADSPRTHNGRVHTSNFANPVVLIPGDTTSVGLTHLVPDVPVWYNSVGNSVLQSPVDPAIQKADNSNWEGYASVLGDSTFLIAYGAWASDQINQNFIVLKQPATGGSSQIGYAFYGDSGAPFADAINLSRQNGNPPRVAADKRYGATRFITEAETSVGQLPPFQTGNRWSSNPMYDANHRYATEQVFALDPSTLTQTPLTRAWDFVYGPFAAGAFGTGADTTQNSRTGGRSEFLDNGNIVVMIDDKTAFLPGADGEVTTFAIIKPDGTVVKGPTLVDLNDIWDNMAAFRGGFAIRVHNLLYFFDNDGNLKHTSDILTSSGLAFGTGRGDASRLGSDIRSSFVYLAGQTPEASGSPVQVAIWDSRTGNFVAAALVSDIDATVGAKTDRVAIGVDALDRFCVAYSFQPTADFTKRQVAARVMAFNGSNITYLTAPFFPFVNHENNANHVLGIETYHPSVAMTPRQILITAKGMLNSTNNPAAGPDTVAGSETKVYTVLSHPAPVAAPRPLMTVTHLQNNAVISWPADAGLFTLQSSSAVAPSSWSTVLPQPAIVPAANDRYTYTMTVPLGTGRTYFRLAR